MSLLRQKNIWALLLCVLYGLVPLLHAIGWLLGYDFALYAPIATLAVLTILAVFLTGVLLFLFRGHDKTGWAVLVLLLAMLNGLSFAPCGTALSVMLILICCGCALAVCLRLGRTGILKKAVCVVAVLLLCVLLVALFLAANIGAFGRDTVIKTVISPQETYIVTVVDSDQGALGGNTLVLVRRNQEPISVLLGTFSEDSVCVYNGTWQETVDLQWANEQTLLINGEAYDLGGT